MIERKIVNEVTKSNGKSIHEGHKPETKGYQPKVSNLNPAKPPQGGSGVSQKPNSK